MGSLNMGKALVWLKRIGIAGIIFFFIKGLLWLTVFLGLGKFFNN